MFLLYDIYTETRTHTRTHCAYYIPGKGTGKCIENMRSRTVTDVHDVCVCLFTFATDPTGCLKARTSEMHVQFVNVS